MQSIIKLWKSSKGGKILIIVGSLFTICLLCGIGTAIFSPGSSAAPTVDVGAIQTHAFQTAWALNFPSETPTPTSTSTPAATETPIATVDAYWQEMINRFVNYQSAFEDVNDQQQKLQSDITLFLNDQWRMKMGLYLGVLDLAATDLENIPNPPAEYQQLDQIMKSIGSETHLMVQNYVTGLDNMDSSAIDRAVVNMQNLSNYFSAGTDEINRLKSD